MSAPDCSIAADRWYAALEAAGLGVWFADLGAGTCHYSDTWKQMLGYEPEELADEQDLWLRFIHPDDRDAAIASGERHIKGGAESIEAQFRLRHRSGRWIWVLDRGKVLERDHDGNAVYVVGVQTDISHQKETQRLLALSEERTKIALEIAKVGSWHFDPVTEVVVWDDRMCEIFGLRRSAGEIPRATWHDHLHPDDADAAESASTSALQTGSPVEGQYRILRGFDGQVRTLHAITRLASRSSSSPLLIGTVQDVTEQLAVTSSAQQEREQFRSILEAIGDAVITTDNVGTITFANSAAASLLGRSSTALLGCPFDQNVDLRDEHTENPTVSALYTGLADGVSCQVAQPKLLLCNDSITPIRETVSLIVTQGGTVNGAVVVLQNLTATKTYEKELAHAASHDVLTNLLNRAAFETAYENIERDRAGDEISALFFIDLDRFKVINDTAGHSAGDAALRTISVVIHQLLQPGDVLARLGGDEFGLICRDVGPEQAQARAKELSATIRRTVLLFGGRRYDVGASIGIALIDKARPTFAEAMAQADAACYASKAGGGDQATLFASTNGLLQKKLDSVQVASDLLDAIAEDRLVLFGQRICSLSGIEDEALHVEVLARLRSREGALISPGQFIPAAERLGIMTIVDRHIISKTLQLVGQTVINQRRISVALNLSANTLSDRELWVFVENELRISKVDPGSIVFEITETGAMNNPVAAKEFVKQARETGCRISLDDFGTGQSFYDYLERFEADYIKIDGSFISALATNRFNRAVVGSICTIAHELELKVIAECVEHPDDLKYLKSVGVSAAQGFVLHTPEPLADVLSDVARNFLPSLRV